MDCFIEKGEKLNKGKYHGKATRISFVFNECPIEECYAKESFKSMPLIPFNAIARHGMNIENTATVKLMKLICTVPPRESTW